MAEEGLRSTWSGGGASSSSSSAAFARAPALPTAFPPAVAEVEALLAAEIDPGEKWKCLSRWCDAMLELVSEAMRGSGAEAAPVEEVWHWLAASERLMRSLAFAEHRTVGELLARAAEDGSQEGSDAAARWRTAARQLRQAQKESSWNAEYLRVVEEPLSRLASDEVMRSGVLAKVVKTLLRSLHHIYCTSAYFKEHRMAALLHRVLKALVARAAAHLAAPREVAAPRAGAAAALAAADQLRDAFQAFIDHYFISEAAAGAAPQGERRPATALGTKGDRTTMSKAALRRKDASELGLWRATVRHSLEHAEHCRAVCERVASLLSGCARLRGALPLLRGQRPDLRLAAEGFLELRGGLAGGSDAGELLGLRNRVGAGLQLQEAEGRLQELLSQLEAAGVPVSEDVELDDHDGTEPRLAAGAEVLTLAECDGREGEAASPEDVQRSIASIQEELRSFEEQLQSLNEAMAQKAAAPRGRLPFRPPSRCGTAGPCRTSGSDEPAGAAAAGNDDDTTGDAADKAAALEVARRASWYKEPPPLLSSEVPLIEVHQRIAQTTIHRCPSRPRTAQPRLFVSRPPEGPAESSVAATGSDASPERNAAPPKGDAAPEASLDLAPQECMPGPEELPGSAPSEGEPEVSPGAGGLEAEEDEAFDPLENSGVSWQIA